MAMTTLQLMEGLRPLTDVELFERNWKTAAEMKNLDMRCEHDINNMWETNGIQWMLDEPIPTFWQRVKALFINKNIKD